MDITRLFPDDEAGCAEAVALYAATQKIDCPEALLPTARSFAADLKYGWDGDPGQTYLARDEDGTLIGLLSVQIPTYDNTNLMWFEVEVHPDHRSRGIGTDLLTYGERLAAELGRTSLGLSQWDLPKAAAFAGRAGFESKAVEVNRRQDIGTLDWSIVENLYADAERAASAYELIRITGKLPDELLDGMVAVTASINDAPKDDLDIEDDEFSPERLRAYEDAQLAHDRTLYRVIARSRSTGELAGHSTIVVEQERPHVAEQHDTAVDQAHRGHRLGALVKTGMLLWLRESEPTVTQIDTWNAESNNHMIAINEQLNYHVVATAIAYQKTL
ncbi:acetyltransferase (GNAT) family protein [Kribbella sp. VKM Ac-2527]|uniref:Acetyltransferase (GNAT) family protein n=1 Tax=Kribbella caucasensis TaxID=2512215 RepID=A0A4R6K7S0_9ACTN|nr:GNAT family N-acetyltransferase [Kribbella sp. VKM Ac-2527]TDO44685.1 acetyltransferase (GNAT) family protein [Kribbella sp. VKM Ac-2527]